MGGNVHLLESTSDWDSRLAESRSFGGKPLVVDFFAEWCGPCKMIAPHFEALSQQYPDVIFLKVDVDQMQDIAMQCGVSSMPTFQSFFNGKKVDEVVGLNPTKLTELVQKASEMAGGHMGTGRTVGGGSDAPQDALARREAMAAAAEARLKKLTEKSD